MEHKLSVQHLLTLLINVNEPLDTANAFFNSLEWLQFSLSGKFSY